MASQANPPDGPEPRSGQASWPMPRAEFDARFRRRFFDPAFEHLSAGIDALLEVAWEAYCDSRKSPRTQPAGEGFEDPAFPLSVDWLRARADVLDAQRRHDDADGPSRVLVVCASPRNDKTCRVLSDWLTAMHLVRAGGAAVVGRYLGYYRPYATSHDDFDRDDALFEEVRNVARTVARHVALRRAGRTEADDGLQEPRPK